MFLKTKNEIKEFSKILHTDLKNDPNVKVKDSWNWLSAKISVAIGKLYYSEDKSFNVNTLNSILNDKLLQTDSYKTVNPVLFTDLENFLAFEFLYPKIKEFFSDIKNAEHVNKNKKDKLRQISNDFKESFSTEELTSERELWIMKYSLSLGHYDFEFHEKKLSHEEKNDSVKYVYLATAKSSMIEKSEFYYKELVKIISDILFSFNECQNSEIHLSQDNDVFEQHILKHIFKYLKHNKF